MTAAMFRSRRSLAETVIPNPSSILAIICTGPGTAAVTGSLQAKRPNRRRFWLSHAVDSRDVLHLTVESVPTLDRGRQYEEKYCSPPAVSRRYLL